MEFVKAVQVDELAEGEGRTLEVGGRWIALFRIDSGFHAIDNACPHMAGPLGAGCLDGFEVVCPIHGWRIDVRSGKAPTNDYVRVARFDTRIDGDWVLVACARQDSA